MGARGEGGRLMSLIEEMVLVVKYNKKGEGSSRGPLSFPPSDCGMR